MLTIINGKVILENEIIEKNVIIDQDRIIEISDEVKGEVLDAKGNYVSPGFIDIHTHGRLGHDTMYPDFNHLNEMTKAHLKTGVTSFTPTTMTMPINDIATAVENIYQNKDKVEGSRILGIHLEGPFISAKYKGAQPESAIIKPTIDNYLAICNHREEIIKKITIAPENEGALDLVQYLIDKKVSVSVGHSNATYEEATSAFEIGANSTTHTFNAMTPLHHRLPGIVGAVMDNKDVYAELILDGKHVVYPSARALLRNKGIDKVCLVTDSLEAAGMPVGEYMLGGQKIWVKNGRAELENGTIAGSIAGLNEEVYKAVNHLNVSLVDAVKMASRNPAKSLYIDDLGMIKQGYIADIIIFDNQIDIKHAIVKGEKKF